MMEKLNLTQEWDKVFSKSEKVDHRKVTVADLVSEKEAKV